MGLLPDRVVGASHTVVKLRISSAQRLLTGGVMVTRDDGNRGGWGFAQLTMAAWDDEGVDECDRSYN